MLKSLLILPFPNDTEKTFNLALSHPLKVALSSSAIVKALWIGTLPGVILIFPFKLVTENHFTFETYILLNLLMIFPNNDPEKPLNLAICHTL